ncbi:hypothetical protein JCM21900_005197 [Sporobolomyces salmonicolor]
MLRKPGEAIKEEARVKFGLAADGDRHGRTVSVEVSASEQPPRAGTAYVFDILAPYFLTPTDDAFKMLLHPAPRGKRDYYFSIRQAVEKYRRGKDNIERFWLPLPSPRRSGPTTSTLGNAHN